jgi:hypothetical protein
MRRLGFTLHSHFSMRIVSETFTSPICHERAHVCFSVYYFFLLVLLHFSLYILLSRCDTSLCLYIFSNLWHVCNNIFEQLPRFFLGKLTRGLFNDSHGAISEINICTALIRVCRHLLLPVAVCASDTHSYSRPSVASIGILMILTYYCPLLSKPLLRFLFNLFFLYNHPFFLNL